MPIFIYGEAEINHLKSRDKALSAAIDEIGVIEREVNPDVFSMLINSIAAPQYSHDNLRFVQGDIADTLAAFEKIAGAYRSREATAAGRLYSKRN